MPTDPSLTARDIVDELALLDPEFAQDRDLAIRVVQAMLAERPDVALRPGFRQELRGQLVAAAQAMPPRRSSPSASGLSRLRSFFVGSGVGTAVGAVAAYAFLVFVAPVSPDITAPVSLPADRFADVGSGFAASDTGTSTTLMADDIASPAATSSGVAPESVADVALEVSPEPAVERPASRPQSAAGDGSADQAVDQAPEPVSNSVRNSVSDTASSPQRTTGQTESVARSPAAEKSVSGLSSEDAFSLSDIFSPIPDRAASSAIMADTAPVASPVLAPDPANYTLEVSSGATASMAALPATPYAYVSRSSAVTVPRTLAPALSSASKLSLRFMTAADDSPYGLSYSVDTIGGSIFATKNDPAWPLLATASGTASDERIIAEADTVVRPIRAGVMRFASGAIVPETAASDTVTVRYAVLAEGTEVYEAYGMAREATVSYDRPTGRISGYSLPRVAGFSRTADVYVVPTTQSAETYVRRELAGRGYAAGRYRVASARYVLSPDLTKNPDLAVGDEKLVPSVLLEVVSDTGVRESFVMPFGR